MPLVLHLLDEGVWDAVQGDDEGLMLRTGSVDRGRKVGAGRYEKPADRDTKESNPYHGAPLIPPVSAKNKQLLDVRRDTMILRGVGGVHRDAYRKGSRQRST